MTHQTSQFLPAEWAEQSGVMLTWPHAQGDWGHTLDSTEQVFINMAREIACSENLLICCFDVEHKQHVAECLHNAGVPVDRLFLYIVPSNDIWVRDHGPITIMKPGGPCLMDFTFNGWGNKYPAALDNAVTRTLHEAGAFGETELESIRLVLEGGSIEVDGKGTLMTTSNCLLSPNRNPQIDCDLIETMLGEIFGITHFLWLKHGQLAGDDTDGHIDTLARFTDDRTIAYASSDDMNDENHNGLKAMEQELKKFLTPDGDAYRLVRLPSPAPKYSPDGERLPATYANFLIINHAVLVPTYEDSMDAVALECLAPCFPDRKIVPINCLPLVSQYGSLHCATMQLPAGIL